MKYKTTATICTLSSLIQYIVAIIKIFNSGFSSAVIWMCSASCFLCIGVVYQRIAKASDVEDTPSKK